MNVAQPSPQEGPAIVPSWPEGDRSALLEAIDDSDYSLADWLSALDAFERWLEARGEARRPWREIVGYLHCCTRMASPGIPLGRLEVIVDKALTDFGFEFITEAQE